MKCCSKCDPTSEIPHLLRSTKFRVSNLCCSGEEKMIYTSLQNINGITEISVNIIGRYAVIKHCPIQCCAPTDRIVFLLNEKYLGILI